MPPHAPFPVLSGQDQSAVGDLLDSPARILAEALRALCRATAYVSAAAETAGYDLPGPAASLQALADRLGSEVLAGRALMARLQDPGPARPVLKIVPARPAGRV